MSPFSPQCTRTSRGLPIILPIKHPVAHFSSHFLTFNLTQTFQSHRFWCSSARLIFKSNFLANSDPAMSPRTPNVGVVDFGEEEIREQPRDIGKRGFLTFLRNLRSNEGTSRFSSRFAALMVGKSKCLVQASVVEIWKPHQKSRGFIANRAKNINNFTLF
jgi:hypothetical protein